MRNKPIGIFDSGVGGLTVVKEIKDVLPDEEIIYLGDMARVPYGPRELPEVRRFVEEIVAFFNSLEIKMLVVACNTATAAGMDIAERSSKVPVIGVIEPGAKAAVRLVRDGPIGVISTEATARSGAYQAVISRIAPWARVYSKACPALVDLIEDGKLSGNEISEKLQEYLSPLIERNIDVLILGCTHYPLIEDMVAEIVGPDVTIVNSARETAKEVKRKLVELGLLRDPADGPPRDVYLSTADSKNFKTTGERFLGRPIGEIKIVSLDSVGRF